MFLASESELDEVLAELSAALVGQRLHAAHDSGSREVALTFRDGETREIVSICVRAPWARVGRVEARPTPPKLPSGAAIALRESLVGARLAAIFRAGTRVTFEFEKSARDSHAELRAALLIDLATAGAALWIQVAGRGETPLLPPEDAVTPVELRSLDRSGVNSIERSESDPWAANRALATRALELESSVLDRESRRDLTRRARKGIDRRRRALRKVRAEMDDFRDAAKESRLGELLKGSFHLLRRGQSEVEVTDWFQEGLPRVRVPLDPSKTPEENVEKYFRRSRKAARARPVLEKRLDTLERETEALDEVLAEIECAPADALESLRARLDGIEGKRRSAVPRRRASDTPLGPRRFLSADAWEILVGRNARQNDELTLRIARGRDLFVHVSGRPGAHVIVRSPSRRADVDPSLNAVPSETLVDAATLAIYYSLPSRSGGVFDEGLTAEVDYTPVKRVSKAKGAPPGSVMLAGHRSIRVRLERERFERLRRDSANVDPLSGA